MSKRKSAFIAFPSGQELVEDAIQGAAALQGSRKLDLMPWPTMRIWGLKLDNLIREKITQADAFAADITFPNFNVYYEIGYAIAKDKPFIPLVNTSVLGSRENANRIGFFDTIGWVSYSNADEISDTIDQWQPNSWTNKLRREKDHSQPLFILDSKTKSDFRNYVFSAATNSSVNFRTYDVIETPRLTVDKAIVHVTSSTGLILPLQNELIDGALENNLRVALLAGLSHGYGLEPLIIQYKNSPAPIDFRDFISNSASRAETDKHVSDYCQEVLIKNQRGSPRSRQLNLSVLNKIDLGAAAAENETQQLSYYFVQTASYARAARAESALVVGRKGSGKTAIYFSLMSEVISARKKLAIEMRPSSHGLSELRENLLEIAGHGVFEHTIGAFWHYIVYLELILAVRESALSKAKRNFDLQNRISSLEERFSISEELVAGDFTSRLELAIGEALDNLKTVADVDDIRTNLTNALYETAIPELRNALVGLSDIENDLVLLIDDLDKGWPARQLEEYDVSMLRHLIDVLHRIQRDLNKRQFGFKFILSLRSDVYENLVQQTPDRGKYNTIVVDWSDRDQLRNMLRERVITNFDEMQDAADAWQAFNPKFADGRDAVDLMIDASLYRPRFLIEAAERVLAVAINRGRSFVIEDDVESGLRQMSMYLVSEFGFEIRDVVGTPERIFYNFIGKGDLITYTEAQNLLSSSVEAEKIDNVIEMLLWYGFFGIAKGEENKVFIFDRAYDFPRLMAELPSDRGERLFAVNQAFLRGLDQTH